MIKSDYYIALLLIIIKLQGKLIIYNAIMSNIGHSHVMKFDKFYDANYLQGNSKYWKNIINLGEPMKTFSFIARMPDNPGALHRAAEIIKEHGGNIHRVDDDRRIPSHVVFFQVEAKDEDAPEKIKTTCNE